MPYMTQIFGNVVHLCAFSINSHGHLHHCYTRIRLTKLSDGTRMTKDAPLNSETIQELLLLEEFARDSFLHCRALFAFFFFFINRHVRCSSSGPGPYLLSAL